VVRMSGKSGEKNEDRKLQIEILKIQVEVNTINGLLLCLISSKLDDTTEISFDF